MRFCIVGAGAIGAYVGAALSRGGHEVVLVARGQQLDAIRRNGVRVTSPRGDFLAHCEATDDLNAVADSSVVILGVKAYSLAEIAPRVGALLRRDTAVIPAQNGIPWWYFHGVEGSLSGLSVESVDPGGLIWRSIDPDRVVGCVVYCATELVAPGVIRHVEGTRFTIGEPTGQSTSRCDAIARAFVEGGLKCHIDNDLRGQIWLKLIGNAALNPVTALTGATLGQLGEHADLVAVLRAMMAEGLSVATALGVRVPVSLERRLAAGIAVGDHKTSMLQDLERGRPLELDCLTGAIIELADRLGVPVPHMKAVHACLSLMASLRWTSAAPATLQTT